MSIAREEVVSIGMRLVNLLQSKVSEELETFEDVREALLAQYDDAMDVFMGPAETKKGEVVRASEKEKTKINEFKKLLRTYLNVLSKRLDEISKEKNKIKKARIELVLEETKDEIEKIENKLGNYNKVREKMPLNVMARSELSDTFIATLGIDGEGLKSQLEKLKHKEQSYKVASELLNPTGKLKGELKKEVEYIKEVQTMVAEFIKKLGE